jgi:23S rRNA pseudouridine955/2504/2580 synthase
MGRSKKAERQPGKKSEEYPDEHLTWCMATDLFYRMKFDIKPVGQLQADPIEFPRLHSRCPADSEGIADNEASVKQGHHPVLNADRGGQTGNEGRMTGGHTAGPPQECGQHVPRPLRAATKLVHQHLDELRKKPAEKRREEDTTREHRIHVCCNLALHRCSFHAAMTLCQDNRFRLHLRIMTEETIAEDDNGRRLDRVLRKAYPAVPPGAIAGAVRRGDIRINGKRVKNDTRVETGDRVRIPDWEDTGRDADPVAGGKSPALPAAPRRRSPPPQAHVTENRIVSGEWSVPILERSDDWIALNKPQGLASHGEGGLDEILRVVARGAGWWSDSLSFRPGPIHRLDRNTSGVQLFSLSTAGARDLTEQLRRRTVSKIYLALVSGYLPRSTEVDRRLAYNRASRTAVVEPEDGPASDPALRRHRFSTARTRFFPLGFTADQQTGLVAAVPETGRTHQVRCHAAALGIPLVGDTKYGGPASDDHDYVLHAALFATRAPAHVWTAPLASATYGLLRTRFGDLTAIEHRLNELIPLACTGCPAGATIRV